MTQVPESLPTLSRGEHPPGSGHACIMEYVSVLAGEQWSDKPRTVHPFLRIAAIQINDRVCDEDRHLLMPLIGRFFGTWRSGPEVRNALLDYCREMLKGSVICTETSEEELISNAAAFALMQQQMPTFSFGGITIAADGGSISALCSCSICRSVGGICTEGAESGVRWLSGMLDVYDRVVPEHVARDITAEDYQTMRSVLA